MGETDCCDRELSFWSGCWTMGVGLVPVMVGEGAILFFNLLVEIGEVTGER